MVDEFSEDQFFYTVSILGVGLIGGSIGLALKQRGLTAKVIGCARTERTLHAALDVGAIDEGTHDPCEAAATADLVIIGTPVGDIVPTFERILPHLKDGALVTDVGSTKTDITRQAEALLQKSGRAVFFVGGHPMAGSEKTGPSAASADLFSHATWAITPTDRSDDGAVSILRQLTEKLGAHPLILDPQLHDAIVAYTSHLPHLVSSALVNAVAAGCGDQGAAPLLAASGFRDMTRLAESSTDVWRDICATNRRNIVEALTGMQHQLHLLQTALQNEDEADLVRWLHLAAEKRPELARRSTEP